MARKLYRRRVWGGFHDGRLYYGMIDTGWGGWGHRAISTLLVFTSKADAKRQFEDVRPIEIRELPRKHQRRVRSAKRTKLKGRRA